MIKKVASRLNYQIEKWRRSWIRNQRTQVQLAVRTLGNADYGSWTILEKGVHADSVVYSFGVGEDISWDLAMIEVFGVQVHAFDPTPRSIDWVQAQTLPAHFHFHPFGIADEDGTMTFFPPENEAHVSHTMISGQYQTGERAITVPVKRLKTIMTDLGHDHIDVLKMDIEGAEYDVIGDILHSATSVSQLLVEFHHDWESIHERKTQRAIESLNQYGYRIFYISHTFTDYSFIRRNGQQ